MVDQEVERARERVREGVTMALYVSLSLLAVTAALPSDLGGDGSEPALVILLTSVGLVLAHALAFRISARLVDRGRLEEDSLELLGAQLAGGAAVTVVALVPIVLLGTPDGIRVAGFLLVGFVALTGYVAARSADVGRGRALRYVVGVVVRCPRGPLGEGAGRPLNDGVHPGSGLPRTTGEAGATPARPPRSPRSTMLRHAPGAAPIGPATGWRARLDRLDRRITVALAAAGVPVLRISLGIVFLWFGALKLVPGLSPAEDLAARTIEMLTLGVVPPTVALPVLAAWEVLIGLGLLSGRFLRATLALLAVQMLGTLTPLVLLPAETFTVFPIAPTLEGQYIIKNLVLVAAAMVVGATVRGGQLLAEPVPVGEPIAAPATSPVPSPAPARPTEVPS